MKQWIRTYLQLDGAIFLALTADGERKGQLVPVLLRITAELESAYERFNALASYALVITSMLSAFSLILCMVQIKLYSYGKHVVIIQLNYWHVKHFVIDTVRVF